MIRIAVTGPESTGKTTLARQLARRYGAPWTPEYARYYLRRLNRPYVQDDLLAIARGQLEWEEAKGRRNPEILFSDTCLLVIKIWSEFKYGNCHPWILEQLRAHTYDLYLLCGVDLPKTLASARNCTMSSSFAMKSPGLRKNASASAVEI
jgi:nicotinamide riboside kinase